MITHHPVLPYIIAKSFSWNVVDNPLGLQGKWVDTRKEIISLPHFSYGYWLPSKHLGVEQKEISGYRQLFMDYAKFYKKPMQWRLPLYSDEWHTLKVASWLNIKPEETIKKINIGNLGRKIRRAQKYGLRVEMGKLNFLDAFFSVYEKRLHELGSAALPQFFFREILMTYPDQTLRADARIYLVYHEKEVIGGAFTMFYNDFCENTWFATLKKYQNTYASYLLHYHMIIDAANAGSKIYSFGRSTMGSGVHLFKKQWGTQDVPLVWLQYPEHRFSLKSYPQLLKVWKHVPLTVARLLNRYLAKWNY